MELIFKALDILEKRFKVMPFLKIYSDGSGTISYFDTDGVEDIHSFTSTKELDDIVNMILYK